MKNFPDIALRMGPYELVSPWFVDYVSFVNYGLHLLGRHYNRFAIERKRRNRDVSPAPLQKRERQSITKMSERGEWIEAQAFARDNARGSRLPQPMNYRLRLEWNEYIPNGSASSTF